MADNDSPDTRMETFKKGVLDLTTEQLRSVFYYSDFDIHSLTAYTNQILQDLFNQYLDHAKVSTLAELEPGEHASLIFSAISAINGALPLDHEYIVVYLHLKKDNTSRVAVLRREKIPGIHDCLNQDIVPILDLDHSYEEVQQGLSLDNLNLEFNGKVGDFSPGTID